MSNGARLTAHLCERHFGAYSRLNLKLTGKVEWFLDKTGFEDYNVN